MIVIEAWRELLFSLLLVVAAAGCSSDDGEPATPGPDVEDGADQPTPGPDTPASTDEGPGDQGPAPDADAGPPEDGSGDGADAVPTVELPEGCFLPGGAECDPRDSQGCNLLFAEVCDLAADQGQAVLVCFPGPAVTPVGEPCDNDEGPWCHVGLHCDGEPDGVCVAWCCGDSDCEGGTSCEAISAELGTLGFCK